jgi:hypothetical protein
MLVADGAKPAAHYIATGVNRTYQSNPFASFTGGESTDIVYRFWTEDAWVSNASKAIFHLDNGIVTVTTGGVYLIYATITYHDISGRWSVALKISDEAKAKCVVTEQLGDLNQYDANAHGSYQQCSITYLTFLRKNQNLSLACLYGSRKILTSPQFTYWGIVKQ